jgi:hypothetical protein
MLVYDGGETHLHVEEYRNGGLAVTMDRDDPEDGWEPYGVVTVNLPMFDTLGPRRAFVDSNNMPDIGKWLEDNSLAYCSGLSMPSGYCEYEMYEFTDRFFKEAGVTPPEGSMDFAVGKVMDVEAALDANVIDIQVDMVAKNGDIMPVTIHDMDPRCLMRFSESTGRSIFSLDDTEHSISWEANDRYAAGSAVRTGEQLKPMIFGALDKKMEASLEKPKYIDYSVPGVDSLKSSGDSLQNEIE